MLKKVKIFMLAFLAMVAVFLIYSIFFRSPEITRQDGTNVTKIQEPEFDEDAPVFGQTKIGQVKESEFRQVDKNTGQVTRIFRFQELVNPKERGPYLNLIKPSMILYQGRYAYEIVSELGNVEIQDVAGIISPKSARLTKNVVITVTPRENPNLVLSTILMDQLDYDSERSQFSTEGPLKMLSDDAELYGTGMTLIYNEPLNRLELLVIETIDHIRLKNVRDMTADSDGAADASETEPPASQARASAPAPADTQSAGADTEDAVPTYYECEITENVKIEYGPDIVIDADEKLVLQNILWSNQDREPAGQTASPPPATSDSQPGRPVPQTPAAAASADAAQNAAPDDAEPTVEVIVTCNGRLTVRPMKFPNPSLSVPPRLIELFGTPVTVSRVIAEPAPTLSNIAECARLAYNLDAEIMSMYTGAGLDRIALSLNRDLSGIETTGYLQWFRASNTAKIIGPGRLYSCSSDSASAQDPDSEMNFTGVMDLLFADAPASDDLSLLSLKTARLAGGFNARLNRDKPAWMTADQADFIFAEDNMLSRADLSGNVNFTSEQAPDEQLSASSSSITSDKAQLHFEKDNQLRRADMSGSVCFSSDEGMLRTETAQIEFALDAATGKSYPFMLHSTSASVLETAAEPDRRKTRLKAERIDYDLTSGNAFALGPVRFEFYTQARPGGSAGDVPIVITSQKNARFFARENTAEFNGDVVAERKTPGAEFTQTQTVTGDTLTVNLMENQGLRHVNVAGQKVLFDNIRNRTGQIISHVRLKCLELDYDEIDKTIIATGPGSIEVNNEKVAAPDEADLGAFSLQRPCFARIENFDSLTWYTEQNRLIAGSEDKTMHIGYWPIVDGKLGQITHTSATKVTADFIETPDGRNELTLLTAENGVEYREEGGNELIGETLVYEPEKSLVSVDGLPGSPCLLNGARVENIRYYLDTGKITSTIPTAPGAIPAP